MPDNLQTVESLENFVKIVTDIRHQWTEEAGTFFNPWFRGHVNADWDLIPTIYRNEDFEGREEQMRANFKRQGSLLVHERLPSDNWEWYFLMQHYGAPTRLLDWSDGALLALYFALCPSPPSASEVNCDAAVWMLDAKWLNQQALRRYEVITIDRQEANRYLPAVTGVNKHRLPRLPVALTPQNMARRLGAQRSRFTIHGADRNGLMHLARRKRSRLAKITISKNAIHRMRIDLTTCGIWDTTIFPDLEGLTREVIRDHTDKWV